MSIFFFRFEMVFNSPFYRNRKLVRLVQYLKRVVQPGDSAGKTFGGGTSYWLG